METHEIVITSEDSSIPTTTTVIPEGDSIWDVYAMECRLSNEGETVELVKTVTKNGKTTRTVLDTTHKETYLD